MSRFQISDEDLDNAIKHHSAEDHHVHWMAIELKERRRVERENVEPLAHAHVIVTAADGGDVCAEPLRVRAIEALDKLIRSKP